MMVRRSKIGVLSVGVALALLVYGCGSGSDSTANGAAGDVTALASAPNKRVADDVVAMTNSSEPLAIKGDFDSIDPTSLEPQSFAAALKRAAQAYGIDAEEMVFRGAERDELGMVHARYGQVINNLTVVNSELRLHARPDGQVFFVTGAVAQSKTLAKMAAIEDTEAESIAAVEARPGVLLTPSGATELTYVVTSDLAGAHLAWRVTVVGEDDGMPVRDEVFVDAGNANVVARQPTIYSARNRKSYSAKQGTSIPGTLMRSEGQAASNNIDVNAAYDNLGRVYDYYFTTYGRDSFDAAGAALISTVNYDRNYCNAFWNGTQMVYGDGDGNKCGPLARGLDVTGHELTHAVTERTAGLVYSGESGGLNEAMSDIFGNVIEYTRDGVISANTWMVGEEIWTPSTPGDALRYMDDPARDGNSLDYFPDYSGEDVHYSSGIANLAFKLLTTGGPHPRGKTTTVAVGIGIEHAAAIFYRALATYMTPTTNFAAARQFTAQAANDLFGAEAVASLHLAWDVVGVPGGPNAPSEPEPTALLNGKPVPVAGAKKAKLMFGLEVHKGARVTVKTVGGTGDLDLYMAFERKPDVSSSDTSSTGNNTNETMSATAPADGKYYIMVYGYTKFDGATLTASF